MGYKQHSDGSVEPLKVHTVVISTQHAAPGTAKRTEECAGYTGKEMTAPSMEEMNKQLVEHVIKKTLSEIILKNGKPALTLFGDHTNLHLNPRASSSSAVRRATPVSPGARSSSTPTVGGVRTAAVRSPARTRPRSTGRRRTSAARWLSRL